MWESVPWPLWRLMEAVYRVERVVEELRGVNPRVMLQILGEDHHEFWRLCLKLQTLAQGIYRIGADVEREVLRKAEVGMEGQG